MEKIQKEEPLHDKVYSIMKNNLLNGYFYPREKIVESKIAQELGVSRSPVRESIRRLVQEDFLIQEGGHIYSIEFNKQDFIDVYQCRRVLEMTATELAVDNISKEELQELKEVIDLTEDAINSGKEEEVVQSNTSFHHIIVSASGNKTLVQILESLSWKIKYYRNIIIKYYHTQNNELLIKRKHNYVVEHRKIYEAINNRDSELAKKLMEQHINAGIQSTLDFIEKP